MAPYYPLEFLSSASINAGDDSWTTRPEMLSCGFIATAKPISATIPKEFGGPNRGLHDETIYSPEDLYGMALVNCFAATFQVFAANSKIDFQSLHLRLRYTISLNEKKLPAIDELNFYVELYISDKSKKVRANRLLEKVSKGCLLINSVAAKKNFDLRVEAPNKEENDR